MTTTVPIENGKQVGILVTSSISIGIVAVSVGLRLAAKKIGFGFDYSDYCIVAALVRLSSHQHCTLSIILTMYAAL